LAALFFGNDSVNLSPIHPTPKEIHVSVFAAAVTPAATHNAAPALVQLMTFQVTSTSIHFFCHTTNTTQWNER